VAAPVSEDSFWTFIAASIGFLKEPRESYFYPPEEEASAEGVLRAIAERGSDLLSIIIPDEKVDVPDILWGQLYKAERVLKGLLERWGFRVLRSTVWSDEASKHILIYELETARLPEIEKHMGPPVEVAEHSERFLRKHLGSEETISGPWIEEGRWWILSKRKWTKAEELLTHHLEIDGGRDIGVPKRLTRRIRGAFQILLKEEIEPHLQGDFLSFLHSFLRGRASWLSQD
jgi:tRNA nucleotidyltransferase (CCA-adding enzyme)